jgi:hypothetical protein
LPDGRNKAHLLQGWHWALYAVRHVAQVAREALKYSLVKTWGHVDAANVDQMGGFVDMRVVG